MAQEESVRSGCLHCEEDARGGRRQESLHALVTMRSRLDTVPELKVHFEMLIERSRSRVSGGAVRGGIAGGIIRGNTPGLAPETSGAIHAAYGVCLGGLLMLEMPTRTPTQPQSRTTPLRG